jgi:hypothetical protein
MSGREIEICTILSSDKLRVLARKESNRRTAMRMLAIANELDGNPLNREGIDGLYDRPRSGRPRRLNAEQEKKIKSAVLDGPDIENDGLST